MGRMKQEPVKILTPEEEEQVKSLETESDGILDWIFDHPTEDNGKLISRLNWIDKKVLDLKGESALEVNEDFRR
ncbi:hypothetical protein [Parabacteroides sp. AM08-6]|uniref:hypothetical protein n=1 Tax=Parabacteroides sp. AM08-6 TaxID=2292053 RepID=UPI000F0032C8|nr:hypothetical protein [Parabacteroides sp. AM08-6]RHJ81193.1 hypothetical protein DW103_11645 [Parabacteroides sp. AM08-6]RHJ87603.1 hypothetical protein DW103_00010 [Parabacteroides sp. AM08-6]